MTILMLESLLAPISETEPCGQEMLFSPQIDAILEARRFDDESLHQGEWETEIKRADWKQVLALTQELLTTQSKDLRFAIWLTEAATQQYGPTGLSQGLNLISGLFNRYWEECYPSLHEGFEQRVGHLRWFLQQIQFWVNQFSLTDAPGYSLSYQELLVGKRLESTSNQGGDLGPGMSRVEQIKRKTSRQFFQKLRQDLQAVEASLLQLEQVTDAYLGVDGPSFALAKNAVSEACTLIIRWGQMSGAVAKTLPNKSAMAETRLPTHANLDERGLNSSADFNEVSPKEDASNALSADRQLERAQALRQLREVAAFFRRTEPHSPVTYLAEKAADWGEMSLHEWLGTVIKDGQTLQQMGELLGIAIEGSNNS